ncbi:LuxR family transcriptional regulator [Clostridiaceae bacterium 35-E11]
MNQIECLKCKQWIQVKRKRTIQSFQDSFADLFNISLGITTLNGKSITVWSNSSLFCHYIIKNNGSRCMKERKSMMEHIVKKKEPILYTCYMGITYFACPIFFQQDMVAICFGGGVCLQEDKDGGNHQIGYSIPVMDQMKLNDMVKMLQNIFNLMNNDDSQVVDQNKRDGIEQELFFLKKKLSRRELEVVKCINIGQTNKEIAEALHISEKTVKAHVSNILKKLNIKDRMQLVILCKKNSMS